MHKFFDRSTEGIFYVDTVNPISTNLLKVTIILLKEYCIEYLAIIY